MEDLVTKLQTEINVYGNKIALQQFAEIKRHILDRLESITGISDLKERLSDVPTKKGRPPTTKRIVHITLRPTEPSTE